MNFSWWAIICNFLNFFTNRLKEIFGTDEHFGEINHWLQMFGNNLLGYLCWKKKVVQQRNDAEFARELKRTRERKCNRADIIMPVLKTECQPNQEQNKNITRLSATKKETGDQTTCCLESIDESGCVSYSHIILMYFPDVLMWDLGLLRWEIVSFVQHFRVDGPTSPVV